MKYEHTNFQQQQYFAVTWRKVVIGMSLILLRMLLPFFYQFPLVCFGFVYVGY